MKKGKALSVLVLAAAMLLSGLFCAGSLASGAVVTSITVKNTAPIAENLELTTYRGVGVAGTFKATDPEGDPFVFEVTSEPKKGVVIPGDGDTFLYTPNEGKSGRDSFTYTARDENGNTSAEAKVSITIRRQSGAVTYSDMAGDPAQYAALRLAEEDVFTGDRLGSESFFRPAEEVTRGEFLAMCLKIRGIKPLEGITRTSFADDEEAAAWVRPYISAALISGYITGYADHDGSLVFSPDRSVRLSEAAVMLNNVLGVTDVVSVGSFAEGLAAPVWAAQAASNLAACGVLPSGGDYGAAVTRAEAAEMLSAAMDVLEARRVEHSLLDWIR